MLNKKTDDNDEKFYQVINEFSQKTGIRISFRTGACEFEMKDGSKLYIEAIDNVPQVLLYTQIKERALSEKNADFWIECLEKNNAIESMLGLSLCLNRENDLLLLTARLNKKYISLDMLDDSLSDLLRVSGDLRQKLASRTFITKKASSAPAAGAQRRPSWAD